MSININYLNINDLIHKLDTYWHTVAGCILPQAYDYPMGAATFHPVTFFSAIKEESIKAAYAQRCRRPGDQLVQYSKEMFYQYQVIFKPCPDNLIDLYFNSLKYINLPYQKNDIRLLEDHWKSPTLCAYGKGWEVNYNGLEITQITNLDIMGGQPCTPSFGEIAYGVDRILICFDQADITNDLSDTIDTNININKSTSISNNYYAYLKQNIETCVSLLKQNNIFRAYDNFLLANNNYNLSISNGTITYEKQISFNQELNRLAKEIAYLYLNSQ